MPPPITTTRALAWPRAIARAERRQQRRSGQAAELATRPGFHGGSYPSLRGEIARDARDLLVAERQRDGVHDVAWTLARSDRQAWRW